MSKAQLFITCLGDQFYISTLQNMTHLLERPGVDLTFPPEQSCCGQPLFNNGFEDKTRVVALNFMCAFANGDAPIIGPSGSCVSMVKHHYPSLFKADTSEHTLAVDIASGADTVITCEPGCLMNMAGGLHKAGSQICAMHIIDLLASKEGAA